MLREREREGEVDREIERERERELDSIFFHYIKNKIDPLSWSLYR